MADQSFPPAVANVIVGKTFLSGGGFTRWARDRLVFAEQHPLVYTKLRSLACGGVLSVGITEDGGAVAFEMFGDATIGDVADGGLTSHINGLGVPRLIMADSGIEFVAAAVGQGHALLLTADGSVYAFGFNRRGQCGLEHTTRVIEPEQVNLSERAVLVACGAAHSVVALADGSLWAWGDNRCRQLGFGTPDGTFTSTPSIVPTIKGDVEQLVCGDAHTIVRLAGAGEIYGWGQNESGQANPAVQEGSRVASPTKIPIQNKGHVFELSFVATAGNFTVFLLDGGANALVVGKMFGPEEACNRKLVKMGNDPAAYVWAGGTHAIIRTVSGRYLSIGRDANGQRAIGNSAQAPAWHDAAEVHPSLTAFLREGPNAVACGPGHTVFLGTGGGEETRDVEIMFSVNGERRVRAFRVEKVSSLASFTGLLQDQYGLESTPVLRTIDFDAGDDEEFPVHRSVVNLADLAPTDGKPPFVLVEALRPSSHYENDRVAPFELQICPLTREPFADPHRAADGYVYERDAIVAWIERTGARSPLTGLLMDSPNVELDADTRRAMMDD